MGLHRSSGTKSKIRTGWKIFPKLPGVCRHFSKIIRKAGAIPSLYLTWGRKDGDKRYPEIYPSYEAMQKKISSAYLLAGEKNDARILPVGFAYTKSKKRTRSSSEKLYRNDGSHPAAHGLLVWYPVYSGADSPERIHEQLNLTERFQKKMQKAFAPQHRQVYQNVKRN